MDNKNLSKRFNVPEKLPHIKMFQNGDVTKWLDYTDGKFYIGGDKGPRLSFACYFSVRPQRSNRRIEAICPETFTGLYWTEWMHQRIR